MKASQFEDSLRSLPTLLKKVLKSALDSDTFDIAEQQVSESSFLYGCLQVVQAYDPKTPANQNQLVSNVSAITAAVVDRTADLDQAAEAILNARFAFQGRSPYAPDIVLVNEFVKKDFLQALVRHSISLGEGVSLEDKSLGKQRSKESGLKDVVADLQRNGDVRVITQESSRAIVDIRQRYVLPYF